jgi:malonyl CoA-acyl carrier protein transacylase
LVTAYPSVHEVFEAADEALVGILPEPLSSAVFPPPAHSADEQRQQQQRLNQTRLAQPALGAADLAFHVLLSELGLEPDMVAGHSYGEYAALAAAGSLEFAGLMRLSERRGRAVQETQGTNQIGMVAVQASEEEVADLVASHTGVSLAGSNAPRQTIVGGDRQAIDAFVPILEGADIGYRRLSLSAGFHIPEAAPAAEILAHELGSYRFRPPLVPVYSNLTGQPHSNDPDQIRRNLVDQLTRPVRFRHQVEAMYEAGARVFVEVGPGQVLSGLATQILADREVCVLATDSGPAAPGLAPLLRVVAHLYVTGRPLEWRALFRGIEVGPAMLERLLEGPAEPPVTAWLVDGGGARPIAATGSEDRPPAEPAAVPAASHHGSLPVRSAPSPTPPVRRGADGPDDAVQALETTVQRFLDYQRWAQEEREQLLRQFLETQRRIHAWQAEVGIGGEQLERPDAGQPSPQPRPPAVERVAAGPLTGEGLQELLIEVVCERTGYPPEMLDLDLNLESDLGIDSIKRTEIFGMVRDRLGLEAEDFDSEEFFLSVSRLRTLREVLDWLHSQEMATEAAAPRRQDRPVHGGPVASEQPVRRFRVQPQPSPLSVVSATETRSSQPILITEGRHGRAREAVTAARAVGLVPALVRHGSATRRVAPGEYEANLLDRGSVKQLRELTCDGHGTMTSVCHLLPLDPGGDVEGRDSLELKSLYQLATVFGPELRSCAGTLVAASPLDGAFIANGRLSSFRPGAAAIPGFLKALAHEWPEVHVRSVAVDPEANDDFLMAQLLAETADRDGTVEVGYTATGRAVLSPTEAALDEDVEPHVRLDRDSVVLVTGGARGITAAACAALARRCHSRLILVGRTPEPAVEDPETASVTSEPELKRLLAERRRRRGEHVTPVVIGEEYRSIVRDREIRSNLDRLRELSSHVELHGLDVRDQPGLTDLIESVYERFGRIDGVIHGAGVVDDHLLLSKAEGSFDLVFDTKVGAAMTLASALRPEHLQFMVFFSSIAARFGYAGGTDYAAANDALNRLGWVLDGEWDARVVSIGWGPWDEIGIASRYPREHHAQQGLNRISPSVGSEHFLRELMYGRKGEAELLIYAAVGEPYATPQPSKVNRGDGG